MTNPSMTIRDLVGKILGESHTDFLKQAMKAVLEQIMEVEVSHLTGAAHGERTSERHNYRNGYRPRPWDTRLGQLELEVPRLRQGTYFPTFLEPRRRSEQALLAVIQEAYVLGVSTRKVEDLVQALGIPSLSKSEVSRICQALDAQVTAFNTRPLVGDYLYLWLDAKFVKVRVDGRVVSQAIVVAYAVNHDGRREVLGLDVGASENKEFWTAFLRQLVQRGLKGVRLAISDAHEGLKAAIAGVLTGAAWQRCIVHFLRNVQGRVSKHAQEMVLAAVRGIFQQPDGAAAHARLAEIATMLAKKAPAVAQLLRDAEDEILTYYSFPQAHWRQIRSTNPLERLNREIGRRADVVGIFPNDDAVLRLIGMILIEQNEEWQVGRRYFSEQSLAGLLVPVAALTAERAMPPPEDLPLSA